MWHGYEQALCAYGVTVCAEWLRRGYRDTCLQKIIDEASTLGGSDARPPWYNDEFIRAHRSNLIRKDAAFYGKLWPDVPNDLEYLWPVTKERQHDARDKHSPTL